MGPFDRRAVVEVLSARVLSNDEQTVLVETGNSEPATYFLRRGEAYASDEVDDIEGRPSNKRRKVAVDIKKNLNRDVKEPQVEQIPLARVTIDLNFTANLRLDKRSQTSSNDTDTPVILQLAEQDEGILSIKLALPGKNGAVLLLDTSIIPQETFDGLRFCAQTCESKDRPAASYCCVLRRSREHPFRRLTIEATINWLDGWSAFPAGAPVGRTRVYEDYELYNFFFPDTARRSVDHSLPWTPRDFYESVHTPGKGSPAVIDEAIDTPLFPFQQRAVHWMLEREQATHSSISHSYATTSFFTQGQDALGKTIYYNPLQAMITRQRPPASNLTGGILAEEPGLGKTVELTALIAGHPCSQRSFIIFDEVSQSDIKPSKATLIIAPSTILHQWRMELSQHAPKLQVFVYNGIAATKEPESLDKLANDFDIVLTSYSTLAHEVHFATDPPERNMRHQRKYERKKSPLIQILWWRICLDEAQMVESGVTAAARVACRLPRIHSWAVSGTPVKRNVEDLYGLLVFLRLEPFASNGKIWSHLITNHRHLFKRLFSTIALRHTKAQVRDEIALPPQKRVVMSLPFTAVESQHYLTLFNEMCKDVGVGQDGSPASEEWNPNDARVVDIMRNWLTRLRQTCLHPQVGSKNRRRLGKSQGALRTVAEVLDVMIEQNESSIRIDERGMIQAQLLRAHIIGNARDDQERSKKALGIYSTAQAKCESIVEEARARLAAASAEGLIEGPSDDEDSSSESAPILGRLKNVLRASLQLLHVSVYFVATATYQIKINEEITQQDSSEFKQLEEQEVALYERAKIVRREILKDAANKSEHAMSKIKDLHSNGTLLKLPEIRDLDKSGGIESRRIVTSSYELFDLIRDMQPHIYEWRAKIMDILTKPLVDEDDSSNEITGDEYEESTKQQDELYVYFDALKALQADLTRCITGEAAPLIDHEAKSLVKSAKRWLDPEIPLALKEQPHAPELLLKLFDVRQSFRKKLDNVTSVRGLIAEARHLQDSSQVGGRAAFESELAKQLLQQVQGILSSYTKALARLQKEVELCGHTQNLRLEFYRQLQEVSDSVAPYKEALDETLDTTGMEKALDNEESYVTSLAQLRTKHRFLMHLKNESTQDESAKTCVICQSTIELGVLTVCGHQYCKYCISHWWAAHRTCPICKRKLNLVDFHDITYAPKELKVQEELPSMPETADRSLPSEQTSIYTEIDPQLKEQIKSADLGSSYGTKIDTLSRHLLWIREHDPGAKSIVFSQYREFLDVLSTAFSDFKIGYARLGRQGAVETFRQNPSIDCLLLDAKTDSSGLTLVNATHVFICEPLVQTAVELQAVARVHRIGQTRPTTVWMYLVNDTVEESIYEISVKRRLAHVQARQTLKITSGSSTPTPFGEQAIDAANSEELQNAALSKLLSSGKSGGEIVAKSDLWQCLFGKAKATAPLLDENARAEFDRNLRAHAAETRAVE